MDLVTHCLTLSKLHWPFGVGKNSVIRRLLTLTVALQANANTYRSTEIDFVDNQL